MSYQLLISGFLQCLGIVAIAAAVHGAVARHCTSPVMAKAVTGIVFALGGVSTMTVPVELAPGLLFDLRSVFLLLSATYGGWIATLATAGATGAYRLWQGGIGAQAGLVGILISASVGLAFAHFNKGAPLTRKKMLLLGTVGSLFLASVFVLPLEMALQVLAKIGPISAAATIVGVFILGEVFNRADSRVEHERKLTREASTDALTSLATRRVLERRGPAIAADPASKGQDFVVMIIDVDNFKLVNDTYGHAVGDQVLQHLAEIIISKVRRDTLVARYGGEEIAIVLTNARLEQTLAIGERIRKTIEESRLEFDTGTLSLTVSIGLASGTVGAISFWEVFGKADAALYHAKATGKNRVCEAPGNAVNDMIRQWREETGARIALDDGPGPTDDRRSPRSGAA